MFNYKKTKGMRKMSSVMFVITSLICFISCQSDKPKEPQINKEEKNAKLIKEEKIAKLSMGT